MTRFLFILCLVLGLSAGGVGRAQDAAQPVDYAAFEEVANSAEGLIDGQLVSDARLEEARQELSDWRARLLDAQNVNAGVIERLQAQIDALGAPPADGQTEPAEIAQRRDELNRQLAEAQVPRLTATEAYNRADGLISQIDSVLRARQNEMLLERGPSPLVPSHWQDTVRSLGLVVGTIQSEVARAIDDARTNPQLRDGWLVAAALAGAGLLLLVRGRSWAMRLASLIMRRRARGTVVFLASLGQILLPVVGVIVLVTAVITTGLAGEMGTRLLLALIAFLTTTFTALWLGGQLFPQDDSATALLALSAADRAKARRTSVGIGVTMGVGGLLDTITGFNQIGPAADGVLLLPFFVVLGFFLWRLGQLLIGASVTAREQETANFASRTSGLLGQALRIIGVIGPLLSLAGYDNAASSLMQPTGLTLGLLAFFLALQVPIRDIYALITRTPVADAGGALVPVLVNFLLAIVSVPLLALIWGMRPAELGEYYARVSEGFSLGDARITPGDVLRVILVFAIAYTVVRLIQGALKSTVLPRTKMDVGAQNAIVSGLGYVGIAIAALMAINAGGIDLTALAFVLSALSVGIGFGLQNVVQNFVAGIILLIERPIGEGDWIEVGGNMGIVKSISVRSTTIETFDKQQLIVPNGDFISGTVTNWTRGSQIGRAVVTVGVAYGNDTRRVQEILLEIATENPQVMKYPEPGVDFVGFGADSLDFRIRAMLYDVNTLVSVQTEIHHRIAERFAEEGIEIPFAQRDIWLRNPEALCRDRPGKAPADFAGRREDDSLEEAAEQDNRADPDGDEP